VVAAGFADAAFVVSAVSSPPISALNHPHIGTLHDATIHRSL